MRLVLFKRECGASLCPHGAGPFSHFNPQKLSPMTRQEKHVSYRPNYSGSSTSVRDFSHFLWHIFANKPWRILVHGQELKLPVLSNSLLEASPRSLKSLDASRFYVISMILLSSICTGLCVQALDLSISQTPETIEVIASHATTV